MSKIKWLDTEYIRNDLTVQPVLVDETLWYTVFDSNGYNFLFNTFLGLYKFLVMGKYEDGNIFESEEDMIKYLEKL